MKKRLKILGKIVLFSAILFLIIACGDGSGSGSGGTVTLTDIPAVYNGKYILFIANGRNGLMDLNVRGCQEYRKNSSEAVRTQISDGKAKIPLLGYYLRGGSTGGSRDWEPYKGNDTFEDICVAIYETPIGAFYIEGENLLGEFQFPPLTFFNGSATKSWNDNGDEWINNIPLVLVGSWYFPSDGKESFAIESDGTGSIKGQSIYTVQMCYNPREVRFTKGNSETGRFTFKLNGDGNIWMTSGTGPFASWVTEDDGRPFCIYRVGRFILTDIPMQYNGKYAVLFAFQSDDWVTWLNGAESIFNFEFIGSQISNGRVSIPMWFHGSQSGYSGSDTYVTVHDDPYARIFVRIISNKVIPSTKDPIDEPGDDVYFSSVKFSLGRATKSYNERMQ